MNTSILHLNLKCKSFISFATVRVVAVSTSVSNYIARFFLFFFTSLIYSLFTSLMYSSTTRKLVVFVIGSSVFPAQRGLLRFCIPRQRDSFGARKDNVSVGACMRPDASQHEQWRDNVSRYRWLNARALTSSQMQRRNVNVTRARPHVKFVRGNISVGVLHALCTCINDRAKFVDENEYTRESHDK